jgi:hypothetical protein
VQPLQFDPKTTLAALKGASSTELRVRSLEIANVPTDDELERMGKHGEYRFGEHKRKIYIGCMYALFLIGVFVVAGFLVMNCVYFFQLIADPGWLTKRPELWRILEKGWTFLLGVVATKAFEKVKPKKDEP